MADVLQLLKESLNKALSYADMLPETETVADIKFDIWAILQKVELNP